VSLAPESGPKFTSRKPLTLQTSGFWFAGMLALTVAAFWPSYVSKLPGRMDVYTHVHALLMTVWFALLIAQPLLIRARKRSLHRWIGASSYVLVPMIAVSWLLLTHVRATSMPDPVFEKAGQFFYLPFISSVLFLVAWILAMLRRKVPALHARYMICTAFAAVDAIAARLLFFYVPPFDQELMYQVIGYGVTDALILLLWFRDSGPYRRAFLQMLVVFVIGHLLWFSFGQTAAWLDLVRWFRGLPLT
jgi:hypothetical protein